MMLKIEFGSIIKHVYRRVTITTSEPKISIITEHSHTRIDRNMHGRDYNCAIMMSKGNTLVTDFKKTVMLDLENSKAV